MILKSLSLHRFRRFAEARFNFGPRWNWIVGPNASGKTTVLEAVYLLSRGSSFRTRRLKELVQRGERGFAVLGEAGVLLGIALKGEERILKVAGKRVRGRAELARHLAVQLIAPSLYGLLEGSPSERRRFLDFGLFYTEPGYLERWQAFHHALRQRNAALKRRDPSLPFWERRFLEAGIMINESRRRYLARFAEALACEGKGLGFGQIELRFLPGWPRGLSLEEVLARDRQRDLESGYTQSGPHRDDFVLSIGGEVATGRLSRGQMKLLTSAMAVVQARLLRRPVVLLIDDLAAELDREFQERFWKMVRHFPGQCLITALEESLPARFGGEILRLD